MSSQDAIAFWLTEEKPDKTRRRRSCLGCGDTQEYLIRSNRNDTKEPAPSYVAWFKAHQTCRPDKNFEAEMPQEPGIVGEDVDSLTESLPQCPSCGFVGVYLTPLGKCMDCAGIPLDQQEGLEERQHSADLEASDAAVPVQTPALHTREALLDRSPANPGHKSHAGAPIPVSEALMIKIAQGYSGQSIAEKSAVRKPFIHDKALYAQVHNNFRVQGGLCAYKLIPRSEWPGEALEYKNLNPETGYHGIEVKCGKTPYVMQGPEVTFVCEEKVCEEKE